MQSEIIRGGYGRNTYNNWFQVRLTDEAWIILIKAGSKLATENAIPTQQIRSQTNTRFEFSVYDLNQVPIEGRSILDNPLSLEVRSLVLNQIYITFQLIKEGMN